MEIRNAIIDDLDACYELESLCFPEEEAASKTNIEKRIDMYSEGFFVLQHEDRLVGHINSGCTFKSDITDEGFKALVGHDPDGHNCVIFSLAIHPEFRSLKYGYLLLDALVKNVKMHNKENILLLCKTALISYYEQYGFTYRALSASTHGGAQWHEMFYMIKDHGIRNKD